MSELLNYIDGRFVTGPRSFKNINPADGSVIGTVSEADREIVNRAVAAARAALTGDWGRMQINERAATLHRIADGIQARLDDFIRAEITDTGMARSLAKTIAIPRGISNFRFFADLIKSVPAESFTTPTPDGAGALNYTVRKPLGVVGVISPWNLPLLLLTWKVAPALAAGSTVVVKPSEESPTTATLLAEVVHEARVPAGVFNLVHGFGPDSAGEFITTHPGVDGITFTGESATGSAIMRAAADGVKPVSFELGGKNPAIIFDDADFDLAVAETARSAFTNSGQVCLCTERVYVQRSIFGKFVESLKKKAEALRIGKPDDDDTDMGPLISHAHREKVLSYFDLARQEGATVVTGGGVPKFGDQRDNGAFVLPTIWTGLPETARCIKEEVFGPVCHVAPFDGEEEAIELANDSEYGLAATVFTGNLQRAHRVASQLEAGIVWVNTWYLRDLRTPFGGVKRSGIGREGGMYALNFYSEPSNVCVKL